MKEEEEEEGGMLLVTMAVATTVESEGESLSSMCLRLDFSASDSALEIMKAILFVMLPKT